MIEFIFICLIEKNIFLGIKYLEKYSVKAALVI